MSAVGPFTLRYKQVIRIFLLVLAVSLLQISRGPGPGVTAPKTAVRPQAVAKLPAVPQFPRKVEDDFRGFSIFQTDSIEFVAMPKTEGSFSAAQLTAGGARQIYRDGTLVGIKTKIIEGEAESNFRIKTIEEGYNAYNILQIGPEKFLGLAQSEGSFYPDKLAAGDYKNAYVGSSAAEVKAKIPPEAPAMKVIEEGYKAYNILELGPGKFLALAQSEGAFSPEKLAAGDYKHAFTGISAADVKAKIPDDDQPMKVVEEGYRRFNILQIGADKFLALPQSEGPFSPEKFAAGSYRQAFTGNSVAEVKAKIPAEEHPVKVIEAGYRKFNILQIGPDKFVALAQSEGSFSAEKLAAGGYKQAFVGSSAAEVKEQIPAEE